MIAQWDKHRRRLSVPSEVEIRNRLHILALALVLLFALAAGGALAAAEPSAHARRPHYDKTSLELVGKGVYRGTPRRAKLKLTVCLRKRIGHRFFDVRCETAKGQGRQINAKASVPGCVPGVWRTTVVGEAFHRNGKAIDSSRAVSRPFRCRR